MVAVGDMVASVEIIMLIYPRDFVEASVCNDESAGGVFAIVRAAGPVIGQDMVTVTKQAPPDRTQNTLIRGLIVAILSR